VPYDPLDFFDRAMDTIDVWFSGLTAATAAYTAPWFEPISMLGELNTGCCSGGGTCSSLSP